MIILETTQEVEVIFSPDHPSLDYFNDIIVDVPTEDDDIPLKVSQFQKSSTIR